MGVLGQKKTPVEAGVFLKNQYSISDASDRCHLLDGLLVLGLVPGEMLVAALGDCLEQMGLDACWAFDLAQGVCFELVAVLGVYSDSNSCCGLVHDRIGPDACWV